MTNLYKDAIMNKFNKLQKNSRLSSLLFIKNPSQYKPTGRRKNKQTHKQ